MLLLNSYLVTYTSYEKSHRIALPNKNSHSPDIINSIENYIENDFLSLTKQPRIILVLDGITCNLLIYLSTMIGEFKLKSY